MPNDTPAAKNWFDRGGQAYARFRPEYPPQLAGFLAESSPSRELAVDVGCGSGQLTVQLATHFDEVIGLDPSADQLAHAAAASGIRYACAHAERLPLPERSASLLAAAQAAHWFELPAFYAEVRRVARDGATIALVSYGVPRLEDDLQGRFERFYHLELAPYWPPERRLVDSGYRDMSFPFTELPAPAMEIRLAWTLDELLGYLSTWSAVQRLRDAGRSDILADFTREIATAWGDPATRRAVSWPINMRVGRL